MTGEVLIVDDDASLCRVLAALLQQAGLRAQYVTSASDALTKLEERPFEVLLTDLRMPGVDGMELLQRVVKKWPGLPVVMLTAHGTVPLAVEAMRAGAADFVLKPFDRNELLFVIQKAIAIGERAAKEVPEATHAQSSIVAASPAMREVLALMQRAASGTATVLLLGETGTGKEVIARALHEASPRRGGPFIPVHCGALPETLLESELFGYEKGAFTGAATRKPGRVELAHGGTLFLDEIGDIPLSQQVKLLRVVQEREVGRLGGRESVKVDVRFVSATHRDLEECVRSGAFREDLFYRLNVVPIMIPPLRERPDDIAALARRFVQEHGVANGKKAMTIDPDAIDRLRQDKWPGNVRQLRNFVERLVVLSTGTTIRVSDVEREQSRGTRSSSAPPAASQSPSLSEAVRHAEREALVAALARADGNRTLAARILGVSRRGLYKKMLEHDVR